MLRRLLGVCQFEICEKKKKQNTARIINGSHFGVTPFIPPPRTQSLYNYITRTVIRIDRMCVFIWLKPWATSITFVKYVWFWGICAKRNSLQLFAMVLLLFFWIGFCLLDQLSGRIAGLCESCAIDAHKCADGDMVAARAPQTKNAVRANFSASQLFNWCSCFSDLSACSRWLRIHGLP